MTEILTLVVILVVLALLGLTWPSVPPDRSAKWGELRNPWWARRQKSFVHREILDDASSNQDFILSLDPTLVYLVTQLWDSFDRHDGRRWLWYLREIATGYDQGGKLWEPYDRWRALIEPQSARI